MAKKIKTLIKLQAPAGEATPAPPVGTALGPHGVPIMEFVKEFNAKTAEMRGNIIPVVITVYEDRTFSFIMKQPPMAELIKKELGITKGAQKPGRETIAKISQQQLRNVAEKKLSDLNTKDIEQAMKIAAGAAKSMGIEVLS